MLLLSRTLKPPPRVLANAKRNITTFESFPNLITFGVLIKSAKLMLLIIVSILLLVMIKKKRIAFFYF